MTGCAVREPDRAGLRKRFPAVDLFLRPDEEPELVDRLGLASAQAPVGILSGGDDRRRADARRARRITCPGRGPARSRAAPSAASRRPPPGCRSSTAATRPAPTASCRSAAARSGAGRSTRSSTRPRSIAAAGYREVTLLGQNVNSYGHDLAAEPRFADVDTDRWAGRRLDLHGRPDLAALIRAIDAIRTADGVPAIPRLRFVTSHPWDLSDRLIAAMAECPSVCEHLHLPVQSGDDAVLRRMGRQYTIEHYLERLARIREAVPGIAISTDVIVGFCGETEAQFQATLRLLETVRYDTVFAAAYSERPGTPATRLADDVPSDVKRAPPERAARAPGGDRARAEPGLGGRAVEVLVDGVTPPRSHGHDDDGAEHRRARRPRWSPAGRARTSSSTSPAARSWSAGSSRPASSTPAPTRSGECLRRRGWWAFHNGFFPGRRSCPPARAGCSSGTSEAGIRSSSSTVGRTSITRTSSRTSTGWPSSTVSSSTTSGGGADRGAARGPTASRSIPRSRTSTASAPGRAPRQSRCSGTRGAGCWHWSTRSGIPTACRISS